MPSSSGEAGGCALAEPSLPVPLCPRPRCHQLKKDAEFREFLSVHQKRTQTATWANDALDAEPSKGKGRPASDYLNFDSDSGQESDEEGPGEDPEGKGICVRLRVSRPAGV